MATPWDRPNQPVFTRTTQPVLRGLYALFGLIEAPDTYSGAVPIEPPAFAPLTQSQRHQHAVYLAGPGDTTGAGVVMTWLAEHPTLSPPGRGTGPDSRQG